MNFYCICILYHWDCGNFDLLLDALKLNLLDTVQESVNQDLLGMSIC